MKEKTIASVVPLVRYAHKRAGKLTSGLTYVVKASDWTRENAHTHEVTLWQGRATACTCPARVPRCRHKIAMEEREQERERVRRENAPLNGNRSFRLPARLAS